MTAGRTNHALFAAAPTHPPTPDRSRFITGNETPCDVPGQCAALNRRCDVCDPLPPTRQRLTCPMCDTVHMAPPGVYLCDHCRVRYGAAP